MKIFESKVVEKLWWYGLNIITTLLIVSFINLNGPAGTNGTNGNDGTNGASGLPGLDGNDGIDGLSGNIDEYISDEDYRDPFIIDDASAYATSLLQSGYTAITTLEDFRKIGIDVLFPADGNYVLLNDLDATDFIWTTLVADPFVGIFDGASYTIENVRYEAEGPFGLFPSLGSNDDFATAMIKNLTLDNFYVETTSVAGALSSETLYLVEVEHVTVKNSFIKSTSDNVGGFFGSSRWASFLYSTVEDSIIVSESRGVGGFIGYANSALFERSHGLNNNIYGVSDVGGLLGKTHGFSLYESSNQSVVVAQESNVGGLVGYGSLNTSSIAKDSFNTGTIMSIDSNSVGGLIGDLGSNSYGNATLQRVANFGDVYGNGNNVGGIIGNINNVGQLFINQAFNAGDVYGRGVDSSGVGGIIGYQNSIKAIRLFNVYNRGNVTGFRNVGGIFGQSNGGDPLGIFRSMYNSGTISGSTRTGGLIGYVNNGEPTLLNNVFNVGALVNTTPENLLLHGHIFGAVNDDIGVVHAYYYWDGVSPFRFSADFSNSGQNVLLGRIVLDITRFSTESNFIFSTIWDMVNVWVFETETLFPRLRYEPTVRSEQTTPETIDLSIFKLLS